MPYFVRFGFLTALTTQVCIFWDVTRCILLHRYISNPEGEASISLRNFGTQAS